METMLNFYSELSPRQGKGVIIGALGLILGASAVIAAAGHNIAALGIAIPIMTAILCVNKEA